MRAIIFDTETTGINAPEIIEAAWIDIHGNHQYHERFKPSKQIELGAMATHHIIPADLTDCRPSSEFKLPEDITYLVGHNIDFDWKAAGSPDVKRICTLALSRWLFPEADSHKQSAMMYYLFPHEDARTSCKEAHSALADVHMCLTLLNALVAELKSRSIPASNVEEIWQASEIARIPTIMTFGKHKGTAIKDIPSDYKRWLLGQSDIDPYLIKALKGDKP
jgi:exodeoxyribonuclease X